MDKKIKINKNNDKKYGLPGSIEEGEEKEVTESTEQDSDEIEYFTE